MEPLETIGNVQYHGWLTRAKARQDSRIENNRITTMSGNSGENREGSALETHSS
jgi:hypothetical protein